MNTDAVAVKHGPYQLLDPLDSTDLERLAESIRRFGVKVPIVVDEDGNIIDGHNRDMLGNSLGISVPLVIEKGLSEEEKRILAVELNAARRQMTDAQKTYAGMVIEPDVETLARRNSLVQLTQFSSESELENFPTRGAVRDVVATKVGLGTGKTYENNKKVLQVVESIAPELAADLRAGRATMKQARQAVKDAREAQREPAPVHDHSTGMMPAGGFEVVLADPPWQYTQRSVRLNGTTDRHYGTMGTQELCSLPVRDVVADDAVLLLWTTWPFIPDALAVIEAWGFRYVTGLPWVKVSKFGVGLDGEFQADARMGVGHWFRGASEPLLLATRGNPRSFKTPPVGLLADRMKHSRKPEEVHQLAESLGSSRLELFARRPMPGWVVVGNEVNGGRGIDAVLGELAAGGTA